MEDPQVLLSWLRARLPSGAAAAARAVAGPNPPLAPQEQALTAGFAPRRLNTFIAGRAAARQALADLGLAPSPILRREGGDPAWPGGVAGSIAHTDRWAVAVAGPAAYVGGLGLDIEDLTDIEPEILTQICRPEERVAPPFRDRLGYDPALARFAAKEAAYKAIYPADRRFIDFTAVVADLDPDHGLFTTRLAEPLAGGPPPPIGAIRGWFGRVGDMVCALAVSPP